MGLFKKLFSIGSRKSKKRITHSESSLSPTHEHLKPSQVDDTEEAVCRLLRSSSGRFAAESQGGLNSLLPLPHPIDTLVPLPKSSSTTLASVSARSTYSVTIHSRTVHSRTEFPNAYPPMDINATPQRSLADSVRRRSKSVPITPRDKSRLLVLRQDPSVASLLNYYDDKGHLDSTLFSNTPSPRKGGGIQRRRTGSTLRQLLGHPSSPELRNDGTEGDISWAEKFLGETDSSSSVSSIGPRTPVDTHFTHTHSIDKVALSTECDTSATDHPTFSSLEVELSTSTDLAHPQSFSSPQGNPTTPQRASQVFRFLGDKKRLQDGPISRLPQPKTTIPSYRRFSADSPVSDTKHSHIPLPRRSNTNIFQPNSPNSPNTRRHFYLASEVQSLLPSPTAAVISPSQGESDGQDVPQLVVSQNTGQSNCGPHGPRLPSKIPSRQSTGPTSVPRDARDFSVVTEQLFSMHSDLQEESNPDNKVANVTAVRLREMRSQIPKLRNASGSSSSSAESKRGLAINSPRRNAVPLFSIVQVKPNLEEAGLPTSVAPDSNENDMSSRFLQPVTPVRSFSLHSHLRSPSSPASSSELSPVAKQMMADLRQQRMNARYRERQAGRLGSGQSRIRY